MTIERVNVLGVGVHAVTMEMAIATIESWIREKQRSHYVCVRDLNGIMLSLWDEELRRIHYHADLVVPDGMAVVWALHWLGYPWVTRVCGYDLMLALGERSQEQGYRHFFYGGAPGVPQRLIERLQQRFPGLQVVGWYSPPFRPLTPEEDAAVVEMINEKNPDIVWVGLSTPKQEKWMAAHVDSLQHVVMLGVGAAFDFHAGVKRRAPQWMHPLGLEWVYRLLQEPRRLWKRYLPTVPVYFLLLALQMTGIRKFPLEDKS